MKKNKIAAVVVTYNRKTLLLENLAALLAQTEGRFDILVIDNHSTDGTKEAVRAFLDGTGKDIPENVAATTKDLRTDRPHKIRYYDTGDNLGGAGGFAYGIKKAVQEGHAYVWLMDDDCLPHPDALKELCRAAKRHHGNFGFLSSKALWTDGSLCRMNVQRKTLFHNLKEFPEAPDDIPIVIASFVSMFIPTRVIKRLGLPIAEFFIWTDDWEYSRRISRHYRCYVVPQSVVTHKTAENVGTSVANDDVDRLWRYKLAYRNEVVLYRREGLRGWLHILIRTPLHIARVLLSAKDHRAKRIQMILQGTKEGCAFFPEVERVSEEAG